VATCEFTVLVDHPDFVPTTRRLALDEFDNEHAQRPVIAAGGQIDIGELKPK
jgi:hypothetical protein